MSVRACVYVCVKQACSAVHLERDVEEEEEEAEDDEDEEDEEEEEVVRAFR